MQIKIELWKSITSCMLILALMFCAPLDAVAQTSANRSKLLASDTAVVLTVDETFKADNSADDGAIRAIVKNDVFSVDGSQVLIKAGTIAYMEYSADENGAWGKAGKICLTNATTKTIDNKKVSLRLSSCKKGGSKLGAVIVVSVLLFPLGLLSGFWKGGMPKLKKGATFNTVVMQDVQVE